MTDIATRIPDNVLADIERIAAATGRSGSWIIVRALRTYLLNEGAHILAAAEGRRQIADGDYEDFDDVISDLDRIIGGVDHDRQ